jgi:hypothetical protein
MPMLSPTMAESSKVADAAPSGRSSNRSSVEPSGLGLDDGVATGTASRVAPS